MRWLLRLAEFDFDFKNKKGKCNLQGDCMSRLEYDSFVGIDIGHEIAYFLMEEQVSEF